MLAVTWGKRGRVEATWTTAQPRREEEGQASREEVWPEDSRACKEGWPAALGCEGEAGLGGRPGLWLQQCAAS